MIRIGLLGNCQVNGLAVSMQALLPEAQIVCFLLDGSRRVNGATPHDVRRAMGDCDVFFCNIKDPSEVSGLLEQSKTTRWLPNIVFTGFHPDFLFSVAANEIPSPLSGYHSKIAMAAFVMGLSPRRTTPLFNSYIFAKLGYFDAFAGSTSFLQLGAERCGLDFGGSPANWTPGKSFMWTPNHPKVEVLFDLARVALLKEGLIDPSRTVAMPDDPVAEVRLPVHDCVASRLNVEPDPFYVERRRRSTNEEFIEQCFALFAGANISTIANFPGVEPVIERLRNAGVVATGARRRSREDARRDATRSRSDRFSKLTVDDVAWCYRTILNREPESEISIGHHLDAAADFRTLVTNFLETDEHRAGMTARRITINDVHWAFKALLDREPESDAIVNGYLEGARDFKSLVTALVESKEYGATRKNGPASADDARWCYRTFLDRDPESDEVIENLLADGPDFRKLVADFLALREREATNPATPPLPPPDLISAVAGTPDPSWFLSAGKAGADAIIALLAKHGVTPGPAHRVLDFGCGVGRVLRHLRAPDGPALFGTDYNPALIGWCETNLRFAGFNLNRLDGKLPYLSGQFDIVYALSVFTHLDAPLQRFWMKELARVLKPGGHLIFSTHGRPYTDRIPAAMIEKFERGETVVVSPELRGTNECGAYHLEAAVRNHLAAGWNVLDFVEEGAKGNPRQDLSLFQKPPERPRQSRRG